MKRSFQEAWQDYKYLLCIGAVYVALCVTQTLWVGLSVKGLFGWLWLAVRHVVGLTYLFLMLVALAGFMKALVRAQFRLGDAWRDFANSVRAYVNGPMLAGGLVGILACFESLFFIMQKATIRFVNPYKWDPDFAAWDKALHFGNRPDEWLRGFFGEGNLLAFFQYSYIGWFFFMYVGLGIALFCEKDRLRRLRFVGCYVLSWCLLGGLAATYFSSAGPVFYHDVYPNLADIYAPLTAYLAKHRDELGGIFFLTENLLLWYKHKFTLVPNAPSAMPSLHAATSALIVIYFYGVNRWAFGAALAAGVSIVVSSIYFGFHYAIDSYVSVLAVGVLWWGMGRWNRLRFGVAEGAA